MSDLKCPECGSKVEVNEYIIGVPMGVWGSLCQNNECCWESENVHDSEERARREVERLVTHD